MAAPAAPPAPAPKTAPWRPPMSWPITAPAAPPIAPPTAALPRSSKLAQPVEAAMRNTADTVVIVLFIVIPLLQVNASSIGGTLLDHREGIRDAFLVPRYRPDIV